MMHRNKFDLIQYHNNLNVSQKINSLNKNIINNIKEELSTIVTYCNAILMHECTNFEDFSGRDVDTFYISNNKFINFSKENIILHQREEGSYRFLINDIDSPGFINLDVEDLEIFSPKTKIINKLNFDEAVKCNKTGLKHFSLNALIYYKLVKYFSQGVIHSYEQLYKIKKILNSIHINDLDYILHLTSKNLPKENIWIKKLVKDNFKTYEQNNDVKNFWIKKRIMRQNKRKVFSGKLKLINLFKSKKFIYAFFFGSLAKWPKNHKPMPAIAIVGNDGAGKTRICDYVIQNFSKMDPAHINMRSNTPIMPFTGYLIKFIRLVNKLSLVKKIPLLKIFLSFIGQFIDLTDKYIRYRIGIAFADAGYGVTIFERYVTDKLRGEYPNNKNKFLPLEQFFSLPDGFLYLDVEPKASIERKINDNHSLDEMISKRKNYISLLEEFSEVKKTKYSNDFEENVKTLKNYIFKLTLKKQNQFKSGLRIKRCIWEKNKNRVLAGDPKTRFQKDSFL